MTTPSPRVEGPDLVDRYLSWLQEAHRHYEVSVEHVLRKNFTSYLSLVRPSFLRYLVALHPFVSIVSIVTRMCGIVLTHAHSGVAP